MSHFNNFIALNKEKSVKPKITSSCIVLYHLCRRTARVDQKSHGERIKDAPIHHKRGISNSNRIIAYHTIKYRKQTNDSKKYIRVKRNYDLKCITTARRLHWFHQFFMHYRNFIYQIQPRLTTTFEVRFSGCAEIFSIKNMIKPLSNLKQTQNYLNPWFNLTNLRLTPPWLSVKCTMNSK